MEKYNWGTLDRENQTWTDHMTDESVDLSVSWSEKSGQVWVWTGAVHIDLGPMMRPEEGGDAYAGDEIRAFRGTLTPGEPS